MTNEEAIERLKNIDIRDALQEDYDAVEMAIKALKIMQDILDLPSVTPQPKMGHWEWVQYDSNLNIGNWHCSECRGICTEMHSIEDAYNYCPNCGADMRGDSE